MTLDFRVVAEERLRRHSASLWAAADTLDELEVNVAAADLLDTAYALKDYWRKAVGEVAFDTYCATPGAGQVLGGLVHLRGEGVHAAAVLSTDRDIYPATYYSHYGVWCWTPTAAGFRPGRSLHAAYMAAIADREIRPTLPLLEQALLVDALALAP
jgi:hypothetical protein